MITVGRATPPLRAVDVPHDGQCLFSSLASLYAITNNKPLAQVPLFARDMRELVSQEVSDRSAFLSGNLFSSQLGTCESQSLNVVTCVVEV